MSDDAPEFQPAFGEPAETQARRWNGTLVLIALGIVVLVAVLTGLGVLAASRTLAVVPDVSGLPLPVALQRIKEARLTTATMGAYATSTFDSGVVVDQAPAQGRSVSLGTPVELLVAVPPKAIVVPDLSLQTVPYAQALLGYAMLKPVVYQQLSDTVPYGRVVSQMPRAGQTVMTGQQVAVFESIGQGSGGAVVPSVVGQPVGEAATRISDVFLVALLFNGRPGTVPSGRVTDQVPAPGTRVPFGTAVPIITATSAN